MRAVAVFITISILFFQLVQASESKKFKYSDVVEENKGSVIYVGFLASWCTPCRKSFPWMNEMQEKYGNLKFKVISINLDADHKLAEEFLSKTPANFSILYDSQ